jgi:hypothetical protein
MLSPACAMLKMAKAEAACPEATASAATLLPSRTEIALLLCAALVQIEVRGAQSETGTWIGEIGDKL